MMPRFVRQSPRRGFSLTELMVVVVVGSIVLIPFGIFMVQMVKSTTTTSQKLLLTSDAITAVLAVQTELMQAETASVMEDNRVLLPGAAGSSISYQGVDDATAKSIYVSNGNLVLDQDGRLGVLASNVTAFSVTQIKDNEFEFTLKIVNPSDASLAVTITSQILSLNVDVS